MKFLLFLLLPICVFAFFSSRGEENDHRHPRRFGLSRERRDRMANEFGGDPEKIRRHLEHFSRRKHHGMTKEERSQCNRRREKIRKVKMERPHEHVPVDLFEVNSQEGIIEYLYQGDINLSEKELAEVESHIDQDPTMRTKRQASRYIRKWENNTVYYFFDDNLNDRKRASVTAAVDYLQKRTCLDFVKSSTATNRIRVFYGVGCWANMGMYGLRNISIGDGCEVVGTAAHEFTHALGIHHSQMRSDRDDYVTVDLSNTDEDMHGNFEKLSPQESMQYTPYEYGSFMHYRADAFVNKTGGMSIVAKDAKYAYTMGHRQITFYDIEMINKFYECDANCAASNSANCKNGGIPNPKNCAVCNCPAGYGGALCDQKPSGCGEILTATANWQQRNLTAGSTSDGTIYDDFRLCNYWVEAPLGQKIETRITYMQNPQCQFGCPFNGIEIKTDRDTKMTNPKYCCPEFNGEIQTSELNPTPIIVYNRYYYSIFTVEYRYVPQPTPSTSASVPTTTSITTPTTTRTTTPTTTTTTTPTTTPTTTTTTTTVSSTTPTTTTTGSTCTCTCTSNTTIPTTTKTPPPETTTTTTVATTTTSRTASPPHRNCTQLFPNDWCIDGDYCGPDYMKKQGFALVKRICGQSCGLCGKASDPCEDYVPSPKEIPRPCSSMADIDPMEQEYWCPKYYGYCEYPN